MRNIVTGALALVMAALLFVLTAGVIFAPSYSSAVLTAQTAQTERDGCVITTTTFLSSAGKPVTASDKGYASEVKTAREGKTVLEEYTENHREEYERVTGHTGTEYQYRIMHTRYGSCSPKKNRIHLNTQLACYAPEIIDSIVYHEYAHFRVLNHSARFYKVLEGYDPAYRKNHAKMRQTAFVNPRTCVRTNLSTEAET
jgi:predicted metal-dependent hydrolase